MAYVVPVRCTMGIGSFLNFAHFINLFACGLIIVGGRLTRAPKMKSNHLTVATLKTAVTIALSGIFFIFPSVVTKCLPVFWSAVICSHNKYGMLIGVGLVFGAIGDITIEYSFITGLVFFLVNHLFDIYAFHMSAPKRSYGCAVVALLYFAVMLWVLVPYVSSLLVGPVCIYAFVLVYASCAATMRLISAGEGGVSAQSGWFACMGSVLFVVSDSLLALQIFRWPNSQQSLFHYSIMITYYLAQCGISLSSYADDIYGGGGNSNSSSSAILCNSSHGLMSNDGGAGGNGGEGFNEESMKSTSQWLLSAERTTDYSLSQSHRSSTTTSTSVTIV